jgi:hypothetical protein
VRIIISLLLLGLTNVAKAEPRQFTSGATRTHLLELYTSEGCSSCPPAEQWLGALRDDPRLWRNYVPVVFHVVYWDHLGWRDRLASKAGTDRQYAHAAEWGSGSVYTPCFVLDGADQGSRVTIPALRASTEAAGMLVASWTEDRVLRVQFSPSDRGDYEVHAAVLGGGIVSPVRAGENEGRTLRHEFVVLSLQHEPLRSGAAALSLPVPEIPGVTRRALAVWVTHQGELASVQATGGWLD